MTPCHPCPCCDHVTRPASQSPDPCPVCYWQDGRDGRDGPDLETARRNFRIYGAARPEDLPFVTAPHERARYVKLTR